MNYPAWDVPLLGSGGVLAVVAIFHVMISQFAIGGGLYLPWAERRARAQGRDDWLEYLEGYSKFFLVLTSVFGAVSGVGIWVCIGLANAEATSALIHGFVFAWAIEWCFFLIELTAASVYYSTWRTVDARTHQRIGWVYAGASFLTLAVINGILTFMLTPGSPWLEAAAAGRAPDAFWAGLFNPGYWPSLGLRVLVCASLAGVWALVAASFMDGRTRGPLKAEVVRWSTGWLVPAFALMPFFGLWYLSTVPAEQSELLALGISTIGQGTFTQVTRNAMVVLMSTATILATTYLAAYLYPRDFRPGYALPILFLALIATGAGEQAREMLRKPWVIRGYLYSSGVHATDVEARRAEGYLAHSPWVSEVEHETWRALDEAHPDPSTITDGDDDEALVRRGEMVFRGQCLSCHTRSGYRSLRRLLDGRDVEGTRRFLALLEGGEDSPYRAFMPPLVASPGEREGLARYLARLAVRAEPSPEAPEEAAPEATTKPAPVEKYLVDD